ncbi:tRNA pseudouridine synthase 1, partial [Entophlyctis sp. JEL0112]
MKLAVVFAYNGAGFAGLERAKGEKAVESLLLAAVATVLGTAATATKLAMVNISRAATTETAEHGARQVVSLEVSAEPAVAAVLRTPTPDQLNALLPEPIRVFNVLYPEDSFSARRSCETRTYEYLIPTYVFMPPQLEAGYDIIAESLSKKDLDNMYPDADPEVDHSGGGTLFTTLKRLGSRSRSRSHGRERNRTSIPLPLPADESLLTPPASSPTPRFRRSVTSSTASSLPTGISSEELSADGCPQFFDPINLPHRGADLLRSYRMTEEQLDMVRNIVAIYRGTHNWHNYIPGGDPDDQRCFMRIINIESAPPEVHNGMEWIRIKHAAQLDQPHYAPEFAVTGALESERARIEAFRKTMIHDRVYQDERIEMAFAEWLRGIDRVSFLYKHFLNSRGVVKPQKSFLRNSQS